MLKISNLLILFLILNIISCSTKKSDENICPKYPIDSKAYQCHNPKAKNFSFLSKYKNLEALDLTGTRVKDLSFLSKLQKIKTLILIGTKVKKFSDIIKLKDLEQVFLNKTPLEKFDNIFYFNKFKNINYNKLLVNNRNLLFSLFAFVF